MTTSVRFRLGAAICAAILLIAAFGSSLITVKAESDAEKAVRNAKEAVNTAAEAAKAAQDATNSAAEDLGPHTHPRDTKAAGAENAANKAAEAADNAQDEAQKQEPGSPMAEAKAAEAKKAEEEARATEKKADEADKKAREFDKVAYPDSEVQKKAAIRSKRKKARDARRRARQARREAAQAILDAEKAVARQAARIGGNQSATQELKDELEAQKKKLAALANASNSPLPGNFIAQGNFIPQPIGSGIKVGEFNIAPGRITVTLPDDIRAGDTISGTVVAEPKGNTPEERTANHTKMKDYVITLFYVDPPVPNPLPEIIVDLTKALPLNPVTIPLGPFTAPPKFGAGLFLMPNENAPVKPCDRTGAITAINEGCSPISQLVFRAPDPMNGFFVQTPDGDAATASSEGIFVFTRPEPDPVYVFPPVGQTGKPVVITGPFDGNATNTGITCEPLGPTQPPTYTPGQPIYVIAESPRKAVFTSPSNLTGALQATVDEGGKKTKAPFRNVGVNLTAPKTSLLKGEQTTLTVQVTGLQNLTQPVPLTLECNGVITMTGGSYQPLTIQPSQVRPDGTYTTTRDITGVQAGGWGATATVVTQRFNACITDDSNRHSGILWNTFTGDYIFIAMGVPPRPSSQPPSGGTISSGGTPAVPPGGTSLSGTGKPVMKGCIITLTHNAPDRRVFASLDTCTKTGEASVQTTSPTTQFTITDRNIADNTCAVK